MTLAGWCLMLGSVALVVALNAYCFYRVLKTPTADRLHAPLDIETDEKMD